MQLTFESIQQFYREIQGSIANNQIQDISHKNIRHCRQRLEVMAVDQKVQEQENKDTIDSLLKVFRILDNEYQYAIKNCVLKNDFESGLRKALQVQKRGQQNLTEKSITYNQQEFNSIGPNRRGPYDMVRNSETLSEGFKKRVPAVPQAGRHHHRSTYRGDQASKKQRLIEELLRQNLKLRKGGEEASQLGYTQPVQSKIQNYAHTNSLLIKENQQINRKLDKLETLVSELTRKNQGEPTGLDFPRQMRVSKQTSLLSRGTQEPKDLFTLESWQTNPSRPSHPKPSSRNKSLFKDSQYAEYMTERDLLQRSRNSVYILPMTTHDVKFSGIRSQPVIKPLTPARSSLSLISQHSPRSRARILPLNSLSNFSGVNFTQMEDDIVQPDIRHYVLPKNKRASQSQIPQDENQFDKDYDQSIRQSSGMRKKQVPEFDNVSFQSYQSVSQASQAIYDDDLIIDSRQNTRIQNTPKLLSITKSSLTRNKVAFFKNSLVLIKDEMALDVAFKRSDLNREMDFAKISLYLTSRAQTTEVVDISYQYDRNSFQLIVNEKLEVLKPNVQATQDLTIYYKGKLPLTFIVVKIKLQDGNLDFVLPVLFFSFRQGLHRLDPNEVRTVSILPQKQFSSPRFMHSILPLTYINQHQEVEYRRGQKSYIAECTLTSKKTIQGLRLEWSNHTVKVTCDKGFVDALAWILADIQP